MRLRNKKTGRVFDVMVREKSNGDGEYSIIVCNLRALRMGRSISSFLGEYDSLAKLYEDWEDYKPTEPLIKDEEIRKAVRAWAEANKIEEVAVLAHLVWGENKTEIAKSGDANLRIVFSGDLGIKMWTGVITVLCGEKECES